jgi:hypothetical protein
MSEGVFAMKTKTKSSVARIVFLDFDGVLNYNGMYNADGERVSKRLVTRVGALVQSLDAQVVISSDWRHYADLAGLRRYLAAGIDPLRVIDTTARGRGHGFAVRGDEIAAWLSANVGAARVAILDDQPTDVIRTDSGERRNRFDMSAVAPWFVRTNPRVGVSVADIMQARRLLTTGPVWTPAAVEPVAYAAAVALHLDQ